MPQYITQYGLKPQGNKQDENGNEFRNRVKMALAQMDGETAAGYVLGAFLRDQWMNHLARRHARQDAEEAKKTQLKAGGNWTDADIDFAKKTGQDMSQLSPDMVSVVDSQGNINPRFAPQEVPAQYVPQHEVVDTTGVILDPTTQRQALFNQRTSDAVNSNLSGDELRKVLAGYWR